MYKCIKCLRARTIRKRATAGSENPSVNSHARSIRAEGTNKNDSAWRESLHYARTRLTEVAVQIMGTNKAVLLVAIILAAGPVVAAAQQYTLKDIGSLGRPHTTGAGINASGQATGSGLPRGDVGYRAFLYSKGQIQDIGTLGGSESWATGINASGQVVGYSFNASGIYQAFLYSNGAMQGLNGLLGDPDGSSAAGINDIGQITGYAAVTATTHHAFLYTGGSMQDLGTLGGPNSQGYAINASGQVTGSSATKENGAHAFLYSNGHMTDLNSLISSDAAARYTLVSAVAINDKGQILVDATANGAPGEATLILTPTSENSAEKGDDSSRLLWR